MSRGPKRYNGYFIWNFIEIPSNSLFISSRMTMGQILDIKYNNNNNNNNFDNNNNVVYNTWAFEGWNQRWRTTLPRHTVIWMYLWAEGPLTWQSQKFELYGFHFPWRLKPAVYSRVNLETCVLDTSKLANKLTSFVNKYTKKQTNFYISMTKGTIITKAVNSYQYWMGQAFIPRLNQCMFLPKQFLNTALFKLFALI